MRFHVLLFLVLIAVVCLTLAQGSYEDCCLQYRRDINIRLIRRFTNYRRQEADGGCNIPAIYFSTRKGGICVDPKEAWVAGVIQRLDKRKHHRLLRRKA